jgi:hypothetical protein
MSPGAFPLTDVSKAVDRDAKARAVSAHSLRNHSNGFRIAHAAMPKPLRVGWLRTPIASEEGGTNDRYQPNRYQSERDELTSAAALGSGQRIRIIGQAPHPSACRA